VGQLIEPNTTPTARRVGPYTLLEQLGSGGQADVFLATDPGGKRVAVRIIRDAPDDPRTRERLVRELELAKRVKPFCTAQIIDEDVTADPPYVVSEFIRGETLYQYISQNGPMPAADLEQLAVATATALAAIHEAGVIHCDFKPDNVILGPFGPRVIDFGIAQARGGSRTTTIRGTPPYLAPERFRGEPATEKCDVFAWAGTIAYAASGTPPFGRDDWDTLRHRVLHQEPVLQGLPPALEELVRGCLAKDETDRPSAKLLLSRLLGYQDEPVRTVKLEEVLREGSNRAGLLAPTPAPVGPATTEVRAPAVPRTAVLDDRRRAPRAAGRLRREAGNPWGIGTAIVLGAAGAAAAYIPAPEPGIAAAVGGATFAAVYLVRLCMAMLLTSNN
jgi:serine/threonine protein kinase